MKRTAVRSSLIWPHWRARVRRFLVTGRAYLVLSLCSMAVFILLGLAGMLQNAVAASPAQSMKGLASSFSVHFFEALLGMELPHSAPDPEKSPFKADRMVSFLLRFLTDLNPGDPKSLLALEMPGMSADRSVLLRPGSGGGDGAPEDHSPQPDTQQFDANPAPPPITGSPGVVPEPPQVPQINSPSPGITGHSENRKVIFIYHSHNRESWFPELKPGTKDANSDKMNVTLVGKRLASQLESKGVGAVQSAKDYAAAKAFNWNLSYKYSLQTIQQALAGNKTLKFFFDLHRDSQHRSKTTASIRGKDYAQVYFIIGHRNPNWKKNEAFAARIHDKLEKNYPGLSRGIWGKTAANGNGEYNQSVSPESVLIEIGGVDNTLLECYRTVDVLAGAIADIYWETQDAEKVNGKAGGF